MKALIVYLGILALLSACGGGTATARIKFSEKAESQRSLMNLWNAFELHGDPAKPVFSSFKMKLLRAYLAEDVDPQTQNNIGKSQRIYENPECAGNENCNVSDVEEFFDFTDPELANEDLNAQGLAVEAGTYKYVRLDFCIGGADAEQVEYQIEGGALKQAKTGTCGVTSVEAESPMVLAKGSNVTINLAYDLQDFLAASSTDYGDGRCDDSVGISPTPDSANPGATYWCIGGISMTPSAIVE